MSYRSQYFVGRKVMQVSARPKVQIFILIRCSAVVWNLFHSKLYFQQVMENSAYTTEP